MKLVGAGFTLMLLVFVLVPLAMVGFAIGYAIVGWWAIPHTVCVLVFAVSALFGQHLQDNGYRG